MLTYEESGDTYSGMSLSHGDLTHRYLGYYYCTAQDISNGYVDFHFTVTASTDDPDNPDYSTSRTIRYTFS